MPSRLPVQTLLAAALLAAPAQAMDRPVPAAGAAEVRSVNDRLAKAKKAMERATNHTVECDLALHEAQHERARAVSADQIAAAEPIGRVRRPGARTWSGTDRVRVVQKTNPDTGEVYVASAYPIP